MVWKIKLLPAEIILWTNNKEKHVEESPTAIIFNPA